jgi:hypothetical protein
MPEGQERLSSYESRLQPTCQVPCMQKEAPLQQSAVSCGIKRTNIEVSGNISGKSRVGAVQGAGSQHRLDRRQKQDNNRGKRWSCQRVKSATLPLFHSRSELHY